MTPRPFAFSFRLLLCLALGALGLLAVPAQAVVTTYADGEIFLGFRVDGETKDYVVNLGSPHDLLSATSPVSLPAGNIANDLKLLFGDEWATRTDLVYSIIGGTGLGTADDPANTIYTSNPSDVPWARKAQQAAIAQRVAAMGDAYADNTASANNAKGYVQLVSSTNSYASYQPGGTAANSQGISFAAYNPTNEGAITDTLYLNRLTQTNKPPGKILLGTVAISSTGVVTFTPNNGPVPPSVRFTQAQTSVSEAAGVVNVSLTRDGDTSASFTVKLSTAAGSAVAGTDFTGQTNATVSFAAGDTTASIGIPVTDRPNYQGSRAFTATLSSPTNDVSLGAPATATVTITDDELAPVGEIAFASAASSANALNAQGNPASFGVSLQRTNGTRGAVDVTVAASGSLASGTDFTVNGIASFADGADTALVTIQFNTIDPVNLPGTIVLTLSSPTNGATLGSQNTTTINVTSAGAIIFTASTLLAPESPAADVNVNITARRIGGAAGAVSAIVSATGTATAGTDYTLPAGPILLSWADGESGEKGFVLTVKKDALKEVSETVLLSLGSPQGGVAVGTPGSLTVSITDPDLVKPTLLLTKPAAVTTGSSVPILGVARDNDGIDRVEIRLRGDLVDTKRPAGPGAVTSFSFSSTIFPEQGVSALEFKVFDRQGNVLVVSRSITFNNLRPALAGAYNGLAVAQGSASPAMYTGFVNVNVTPTGGFTGKILLNGLSLPLSGVFLNNGDARFGVMKTPAFDITQKVGTVTTVLGKLSLAIDLAGNHRVTGKILDAQGAETLALIPHADQALYVAKANPVAPLKNVPVSILDSTRDKGKYTALFLSQAEPNGGLTKDKYPQGHGYGTITVSTAGVASITGKLADGTMYTYSCPLSQANHWPVYIPLYLNKGFITGEVVFDATDADTDASEPAMKWYKGANIAGQIYYKAGWPSGITVDFVASKFIVPVKPTTAVPNPPNPSTVLGAALPPATVVTTPNITVKLSEAGTGAGFANNASIDAASKVKILAAVDGRVAAPLLAVAPVATTGSFTGSFTHPISHKAASLVGVVFQKTTTAGGYFLFSTTTPANTPAESGAVLIAPKP